MDDTFSPEQQELGRSAQAFLTRCCPTTSVRRLRTPEGDDEALKLLRATCNLGWAGLAVPASLGGGGGNLIDQAVVAEQVGQVLFPSLLASSVSAILAIATVASADRAAHRCRKSSMDRGRRRSAGPGRQAPR